MTALAGMHALHQHFTVRRQFGADRVVRAVDDVSMTIGHGEAVGLVGESGSGKTTLARLLLGLLNPTAGTVTFEGRDIATLRGAMRRAYRRGVQAVFQDPYSSLNPRHLIDDIVAEPLLVRGEPRARARERVAEVMDRVGLGASSLNRYPHQFSGGQRQRIAIARALVGQPSLIVLDEPVASLDVSIRSQVINLLAEIKRDLNVSYLVISHDLATTWYLCDRILVMYAGRIVETGPADEVYHRPRHPYTKALIAASRPMEFLSNPAALLRGGEPPDLSQVATGCRFYPRCPIAEESCSRTEPGFVQLKDVQVACFLADPDREDKENG